MKPRDERVRVRRFSWLQYVLTLVAFGALAAAPPLLYGARMTSQMHPYIFWYILYWAIVTAAFCAVTAHQKRRKFDKPMRLLSSAARQVAAGDFSVYLAPLHTAEKRDYIDVMFTDFNKMVEELGSIETLKTDFISNVSHEIKTPLAVIQNYAAALQAGGLPPGQEREYADTILQASQRLTALVGNILRLSKLENQSIRPVGEPFDVCRQLCGCALGFEALWEKKSICFSAELEDRALICADESMLELVWNNLLSNALKFTQPGGSVTLRQTSDAQSVSVSVLDTGCGMDDETKRHMFDQFYQADTSHAGEGNGLGLALVHRVLELTGGRLQVQTELGRGSVFTVHLPAAP